MFTDEQWRPVPGFVGRYSCSNKGRFRSEQRSVKGKDGVSRVVNGKVLKIIVDNLEFPNPTTRIQFRHEDGYVRYLIPHLYHHIWGTFISTKDILEANADTLPNGIPVISKEPFGVFPNSCLAAKYFGGSAPTVRASAVSGKPAMFHKAKHIQFRFLTPEEKVKYADVLHTRSYYIETG